MADIEVAKNELKKRSQGVGYFSAVCLVVLKYIENLEKSIEEKQKHLENLEKVNEELEERIDIMSEGGWIPVEKRLPDKDDPRGCLVVVHYDDPFVGEGDTVYSEIVGYSADSGDWVTIEGIALFDEVTHWQYAPEPPKEGAENG